MLRYQRHIWTVFKLSDVCDQQRDFTDNDKNIPRKKCVPLIGAQTEVEVVVNNHTTKGILDTGSHITTVSESFIRSVPGIQIEDVTDFLKIEVASGHRLAYIGIVVSALSFPSLGEHFDSTEPIPILVVKDTDFNKNVPFIIGTNIISHCFEKISLSGSSTEDNPGFQNSAWQMAFRCLSCPTTFSKVVCTKQIVVPPHSFKSVHGLTRWSTPVKTSVLIENSPENLLPTGLVVTPVIHTVDPCVLSFQRMAVLVENITDHEIQIPSHRILCQLQPVKLVHSATVNQSTDKDDFLKEFTFGESLSSSQMDSLLHLLSKWKHIFSQHKLDHGHTHLMEHEIKLHDDTPFRERYRRIPPHLYEEVRQHLQELADANIIRPSKSPYASAVVLVRKSNGELRFCVDYRTLNSRTIKDAHSLPRMDETLDALQGSKYFSSLDLKAGYYQVPLKEEDKQKTAFTAGPLGFWEFESLPFGLSNAPACFQRLMSMAMGDLHLKHCLLYLDDIIIFSNTFEDHLVRLESVFKRIHEANLKLKASKCHFMQEHV